MPHYQTQDLAVPGGSLRFAQWGRRGPVVLASHGLTANHTCWHALADQLGDELRLVAPDHRGRGGSANIRGPFGMDCHARDLVAILDALELPQADLVVGHSMGGFVAAVACAEYPQRFRQALFVDGGFPLIDELPAGMSVEQLTQAIIGQSMQRLDMRFASRLAYQEFWKQHPAFAEAWSDYVAEYVDYDLVGAEPELHSGVCKQSILEDVASELVSDIIPQALGKLQQPVRFLQAPRGLTNAEPLYTAERIAAWGSTLPHFSHAVVADVNHFTITLSRAGAAALAAEVRGLLA